jgi:hypothetical protein
MGKSLFLRLISLLLAIAALTPTYAVAQEKPDPVDSITIAELRDHIFFLASDELRGRDTASADFLIAANYAATQFREAGLQPMIADAEGKKSFLQPVKLLWCKLGDGTALTITSAGGKKTLTHPDSVVLFGLSPAHANGFTDVEPVFLGYGISEPEVGWDDYEGLELEGKVGIVVAGAPTKDGKPVLPEDKHRFYLDIGTSANRLLGCAFEHKLAGLILVLDKQSSGLWGWLVRETSGEKLVLAPEEGNAGGFTSLPTSVLVVHTEALAEELRGMGFDPISGGSEYRRGAMEGVRLGCKVVTETRPAECHNVVALLEGSDPALRDEYIVVGAHLDHLGVIEGQVMNGADDNASGSAAVLEVAEAAAMDPPKRSVIFVLYTGEEKGVLGSQFFAGHCGVAQGRIVLDINTDMIGRNSPEFPESILVLVSEKEKTALLAMAKTAAAEIGCDKMDLRLEENDPWSHGVRSDQASFESKGIPWVLVTRGFMQPDYHRPSDDADTINYDKVAWSAKLIYELLRDAGNR